MGLKTRMAIAMALLFGLLFAVMMGVTYYFYYRGVIGGLLIILNTQISLKGIFGYILTFFQVPQNLYMKNNLSNWAVLIIKLFDTI